MMLVNINLIFSNTQNDNCRKFLGKAPRRTHSHTLSHPFHNYDSFLLLEIKLILKLCENFHEITLKFRKKRTLKLH